MNKKRIAGFAFIFVATGIIFSNTKLTGAAIGSPISNSFNLVAVVLLVIGLILASQKDNLKYGNYAYQILESKKYVDNVNELKKIARRSGYTLREGFREGTKVYDDNEQIITVIPNHKRIGGKGTSKSILEALASGESNYRVNQRNR